MQTIYFVLVVYTIVLFNIWQKCIKKIFLAKSIDKLINI